MIHLSAPDLPSYSECPSWKRFDYEDDDLEEPLATQEMLETWSEMTQQDE